MSNLSVNESSDENLKSNQDIESNKEVVPQVPVYSAFSSNRKKFILLIVTIAGFLGPLSGNIYIPILPTLEKVFRQSATTINATVSVFMVIFAFAPLIWAPHSDIWGRKALYLISLIFYILANILLAAVPANIGALFVLRIVQAFGSSSVMSVGAGTVADIFEPKHRGKSISYFMLGPQLGPLLGPVFSTIAHDGSNWRWIFGFLAIFGGVVYILILFCLPETLRCLVGNGSCWNTSRSWFVKPSFYQKQIVEDGKFPKPPSPSLKNYLNLLIFKPVLLCSISSALLFATFYGMSVTFARVLKDDYGFTTTQTSISYICPGLSMICGSIIGGHLSDYLKQRKIKKNIESIPEHRFSIQFFGLILSMGGIIGYGWCVDRHVHVVLLFIMTFLAGFGMTWVFVTSTTYLTECSTGQPATMVAIGNFMRNIAAAISSVIIDKLIEKMGFGWCFTGLGLIDLIAIANVLILIKYGPTWRKEVSSK